MHHDLAGKAALVTGGSRGIGAAVARAMAGAGADVAITYVNSRQAAENVAAEMRALGVRARPVRADQADPAAAAAVVRQVAGEFGRLDILVNNAAVAVLGPIDGPVPDGAALDRQIRVNYTSIVAAIRAAARVLPEGGRIINIGSGIATRTGASGVADHAGTKAALAGFTRGAARDLAPKGITVNLLQTGLVATQLTTAAGSAAQRLLASVPLGGWGGLRRSRPGSCSWPARTPRTSPGRPRTSTAATVRSYSSTAAAASRARARASSARRERSGPR